MQSWPSIQKSINIIHHIPIEYKRHTIISTDAEKALTNCNILLDQTVNELGIEGNFPNLIKYIMKNPKIMQYLMAKDNAFLLRSGTRQRCPFTTFTQYCTGSSGQGN